MTIPTQLVLQILLKDPGRDRYGLQIAEASGLRSGTVHPILARLESVGWMTSAWEDLDPRAAGRPARRYYRLTSEGLSHASHSLARAQVTSRPSLRLRPAGEL